MLSQSLALVFVAWVIAAPIILKRAIRGLKPGDESWSRFRRIVRRASIANLVLGAAVPGIAAASWAPMPLGFRIAVGGGVFFVCAAVLQWLLGEATYPTLRRLEVLPWEKAGYQFRLLMSQLSLSLPISLTAVVVGACLVVLEPDAEATDLGRNLVVGAGALLWVLQWPAVKLLSLPGRPVDFPPGDLEREARELAREMQIELKDLLLIRTGKTPIAGAFALGGQKVAITDYLVTALKEDEFLAIIAHELQHLIQRRKLFALFLGTLLLAGGLGGGLVWATTVRILPDAIAASLAIPISLLVVLPIHLSRRRNEDDADDAAILHVGPMPLMTAIAKTYALNRRLRDRSGSSIHRALRDRLSRIAQVGGLSITSVERAFSQALALDSASPKVSSAESQVGHR